MWNLMLKDAKSLIMQRYILKTNINTSTQLHQLKTIMDKQNQVATWSIDMQDIDRVLVVNAERLKQDELLQLVNRQGIDCSELPD